MADEGTDTQHYYLDPFYASEYRGVQRWMPTMFGAGNYGSAYVDLRDPGTSTVGYALVRAPLSPAELPAPMPETALYLGQNINSPLPQETRQRARQLLDLRGQISTPKDVLRYMLLNEAGATGKPVKLAPDMHGQLIVHLGELVLDLA